jgi:undecaprenyl-diphosphatase
VSFIEALFLGALQGVTEFLPVSSSGHLVIAREFMEIRNIPLIFDVLLHISTLLVVILVFRKRILRLLVSFFRMLTGKKTDEEERGTILAILVATVLTGLIGIGIQSFSPGEHPRLTGALFCLTGLILTLPRWFFRREGEAAPGLKTGLIVGIAQGLGVFPGISRSGITITASQGAGLSREKSGEFAFLVSIPAILGALILTLKEFDAMSGQVSATALAGGLVSSFVVGLVSLLLLLKLVRRGRLYYFSFYLIPLGIITLLIV